MKGLPRAVRESLDKARDSAMLAVEVYNKPAVKFKSGGYITLMVIAWTALFHAISFRKKIKPYYRQNPEKPKSRYKTVDGDFKHWELDTCLSRYYGDDTQNPIRKNLEFFIPLRNKIEHRSFPELDSTIFGECQAMLLNFDAMVAKEFGEKYCIHEALSFALQMYPSAENLGEAVQRNPSAKKTVEFIRNYRSSISTETLSSGQYSFKAFLFQVANHESQDTLSVPYVKWSDQPDAERSKLGESMAALVKFKDRPVQNGDIIKAGAVVERVKKELGDPKIQRPGSKKSISKINMEWHRRCWQHFRIRPEGKAPKPEATNAKYCVYDRPHGDYVYTKAWVDLLIEKFKDDVLYNELYPAK
jgi:hypothetical protein